MSLILLALLGCIEADPRLGSWDRDAQLDALGEKSGGWAWRRRGYVEKWAVIGGGASDTRWRAIRLIAEIGDAEACRFLRGELDGPMGDSAAGAMESAGIDDDCARVPDP